MLQNYDHENLNKAYATEAKSYLKTSDEQYKTQEKNQPVSDKKIRTNKNKPRFK